MPAALTIDINTVVLGAIGATWAIVMGIGGWAGKRVLERIEADVKDSSGAVTAVVSTVSQHTTDIAVLRTELAHARAAMANAELRYQDLVGYVQRLATEVG
jgi:hypothetical protein